MDKLNRLIKNIEHCNNFKSHFITYKDNVGCLCSVHEKETLKQLRLINN